MSTIIIILVYILVVDVFKHDYVLLQSCSSYKFNTRDLIVGLSILFGSFIITQVITGISYQLNVLECTTNYEQKQSTF